MISIRQKVSDKVEIQVQGDMEPKYAIAYMGDLQAAFSYLESEKCGQCKCDNLRFTNFSGTGKESGKPYCFLYLTCSECQARLGISKYSSIEINRSPDDCGQVGHVNGWGWKNGDMPAGSRAKKQPGNGSSQQPVIDETNSPF